VFEHGNVGKAGEDPEEPQNNDEDRYGKHAKRCNKKLSHGAVLLLLPVAVIMFSFIPSTEGTGFLTSAPAGALVEPDDREDHDDDYG
jgi:hypothetical protein